MTLRRLMCLATVLGTWAMPLLAMAAYEINQGGPSRRVSADHAPLIMAQDQTSCFCPDLQCDNGTSPGCNASCAAPKQAQCQCAAQCDDYGNPSGSNACECGEE